MKTPAQPCRNLPAAAALVMLALSGLAACSSASEQQPDQPVLPLFMPQPA